MSTASSSLSVRGIAVDVVYKDIKNLHIGVYPPMGRVRVAAPSRLDEERIRLAVIQKLPWIQRQREQLRSAVRQSAREMVTGESHYVWGARHRLKVATRPGRAHVEVDGERLLLYVPEEAPPEERLAVLQRWRREQLRLRLPALIAAWEPRVEHTVAKWTIRHMKTKWGSCNPSTGHLMFNLELAKKHPGCLEYIVVHEMAHLHEPHHGERFTALLDHHLPDWRHRRDQLNNAPLAHEEWDEPDPT